MKFKRKADLSAHVLLYLASSTSVIIVALIFLFIGKEALTFFTIHGLAELAETRWVPVSFQRPTFGIVPLLMGSLLVTCLALVLALPFSFFCAVYLAEIASNKERELLKPLIEMLAAIPSVVIGFFGLVVVAPFVKQLFGLNSGLTALTGAIVLALMAAPTIISISEDALRNVPSAYRQGSLALGATRLQTVWRVTVPAALSGIIAAVLLGVGRVVGETMAVLMVTGNAALLTLSPFESVRTMTATIAAEMGEVAVGSTHYAALFCVGMVLLIVTFVLSVLGRRVLKKHEAS